MPTHRELTYNAPPLEYMIDDSPTAEIPVLPEDIRKAREKASKQAKSGHEVASDLITCLSGWTTVGAALLALSLGYPWLVALLAIAACFMFYRAGG